MLTLTAIFVDDDFIIMRRLIRNILFSCTQAWCIVSLQQCCNSKCLHSFSI